MLGGEGGGEGRGEGAVVGERQGVRGGLFRRSGLTWTGNDPFKLDNSVLT